MERRCRALFISAAGSNQGKTSITAGLARLHSRSGLRVRVFKTGPDFLDPMILEYASGLPVFSLDLWMTGENDCRRLLYDAAGEADLILIEGVMGLYDGTPSSADLAQLFHVPVAVVINASAMAETFKALAHGLATFRPDLPIAGVFANCLGSSHHEQLVKDAAGGPPYLGGLLRHQEVTLPNRHLGLVQAEEIGDLGERLDRLADSLAPTALASLTPEVVFAPAPSSALPTLLQGVRIAVASDVAFSFIYPANLNLLLDMGAEIVRFSPLEADEVPRCDGLYFPGGYPELFLRQLSSNTKLQKSIRGHFNAGGRIYAECGGMLYLLQSLTDSAGTRGDMVGLIDGHATMQGRVSALGYQQAKFYGGTLRGHTFHHSLTDSPVRPLTYATHPHTGAAGEPIYKIGGLTATYAHFYFPSNPQVAAQLFS